MFPPIATTVSLLLALASGEPSATIELKAGAEVHSSSVTLGEVAEVRGTDAALCERLKGLRIGYGPRREEPVILERKRLQQWIRTRLGMDSKRLAWKGPETCRVTAATQSLPGETVARFAKEAMIQALEKADIKGDIRLVRTPSSLAVPSGTLSMEVREPLLPDTKREGARAPLPSRRLAVWVDIRVDGRFIRVVPVELEVRTLATAWVARRDLRPGEPVAPQDLALREIEVTDGGLLPASPEETPGQRPLRLRRPVSSGEALTKSHVEPMPLVKQGTDAILTLVQGDIRLETRVDVQEDGVLGQAVRVKLPQGTAAVRARVTGPGRVEVEP